MTTAVRSSGAVEPLTASSVDCWRLSQCWPSPEWFTRKKKLKIIRNRLISAQYRAQPPPSRRPRETLHSCWATVSARRAMFACPQA